MIFLYLILTFYMLVLYVIILPLRRFNIKKKYIN